MHAGMVLSISTEGSYLIPMHAVYSEPPIQDQVWPAKQGNYWIRYIVMHSHTPNQIPGYWKCKEHIGSTSI